MSKDSLLMDEDDRKKITHSIQEFSQKGLPVVVLHGTDTMSLSAQYCYDHLKPQAPVVFTGAMKPLEFEDSDARQNVIEAIYAARLVSPGVYVSFHGRLFPLPHVRKNKEKRTFEKF